MTATAEVMQSLLPALYLLTVIQVAAAMTLEATTTVPVKGGVGVAREAESVTTASKLQNEATRARLFIWLFFRLVCL